MLPLLLNAVRYLCIFPTVFFLPQGETALKNAANYEDYQRHKKTFKRLTDPSNPTYFRKEYLVLNRKSIGAQIKQSLSVSPSLSQQSTLTSQVEN